MDSPDRPERILSYTISFDKEPAYDLFAWIYVPTSSKKSIQPLTSSNSPFGTNSNKADAFIQYLRQRILRNTLTRLHQKMG